MDKSDVLRDVCCVIVSWFVVLGLKSEATYGDHYMAHAKAASAWPVPTFITKTIIAKYGGHYTAQADYLARCLESWH